MQAPMQRARPARRPHSSLARLAACSVALSSAPAAAQCNVWNEAGRYPGDPGSRCVRSADLDLDGDLDLVVFGDGLAISVMQNQGDGSFVRIAHLAPIDQPYYGAIGDVDGDGHPDLVAALSGHLGATGYSVDFGLAVYPGRGDGTFDPPARVSFAGIDSIPRRVTLGDVDGDGDLDAVAAVSGVMTGVTTLAVCENVAGQLSAPTSMPVGSILQEMELGDMNGDGALDVVAAAGSSITITFGDGAGGFPAAGTVTYPNYAHTFSASIALGDLDADGDLDVALGRTGGNSIHWNDGQGGLNLRWDFFVYYAYRPFDITIVDYDVDGDVDVVACSANGLRTLERDGATFRKTFLTTTDYCLSFVAADLDGDADIDLALAGYNGPDVTVYKDVCILEEYCTGKINSAGCYPTMSWTGTPSLSGPDDFHVTASNVLAGSPGVMFFGNAAGTLPYQGGTLCVGPGLTRTGIQVATGTSSNPCSGTFSYLFPQAQMAQLFGAGSTIHCQFIYRDSNHPDGTAFGLTNGLRFTPIP